MSVREAQTRLDFIILEVFSNRYDPMNPSVNIPSLCYGIALLQDASTASEAPASIQLRSCHNTTYCLHPETKAQGSYVLCSLTTTNIPPRVAMDLSNGHCLACRQSVSLGFDLF